MSERIIAEIILRSADGTSILDADEAITSETIKKFRVEEGVINEAKNKLESFGLTVEQMGATSITVSSEKDVFERVFCTILEVAHVNTMETKLEGTEQAYYVTKIPINIPLDLSDYVADVVLPTPPQFYP